MLLAIIDWHAFFFTLFAAVACLFAVGVLFTSNIVRMAFYLTLSLGATSGLFFLAGAEFVGAMQLMIYVGGTLVLLVFGVMLTAQARFISLKTPDAEWILGAIVGSALFLILLQAAFSVEQWRTPHPHPEQITVDDSKTSTPLGMHLAGIQIEEGTAGYLLPFVIVSVHLLVVLVGAAYMARSKRRAIPSSSGGGP